MHLDLAGSSVDGRRARGWDGHPLTVIAFALASALSLLPVAGTVAEETAWAPPSTVFVNASGHTSDGLFLDVWRERRDLLGDPITEEVRVRTSYGLDVTEEQVVQYYENLALVYLPNEPAEAQVRTLDLGRDALERALAERPTPALLRADRRTFCGPTAGDGDSCIGFRDTGQTLRGTFRDVWEEAEGTRWLGIPLTEAYRGADGSWIQYFERGMLRQRPGAEPTPLPLGLAAAQRQRLTVDPIKRPADIPVFDPELFVAPPAPPAPELTEPELTEPDMVEPELLEPELAVMEEPAIAAGWTVGGFGPGPQQGSYQEIVVSVANQALWAYEEGEMVMSTYVSTGTAEVVETTTPVGAWSILTKFDVQDMEGTISGEHYFVEDVPYVMYFDNLGNALHGTYWHSNFGTPMSHGCINLPMDVASWMYGWAGVGTAVTVVP